MGIIRELPPSVINQIAAGEVVERPASVVKELLENAIDAGATRVEVAVERGGKDLVRVADDGKGMDRDDLLLAFRPHATSKLAGVDDLSHIRTLGFRGEALAAIAEVAKVRCQSRPADAPAGAEVTIEAGVPGPVRDWGGPHGTVFEVRSLFHNAPVRRTFLKSDSTESGHVLEMFTRVALAHPTIQFTFRSGGKVVYDLPAVTGLKERIALFFGRELADSLLWVESQVEQAHLWGYVAHPSQSRSTTKGQYLFVGGRYVRDRSLAHALAEAYRGLLMVGRMPVAFLHLELPAEDVDVNVHPTKIEVRFRDSQRVYSQLLSTVRQTFLTSDLHSQLHVPGGSEPARAESGAAPAGSSRPFRLASPPSDRQEVSGWFPPAGASSGPAAAFRSYPAPGYAGGPGAGAGAAPAWARSLPPASPATSTGPFDEFGSTGSLATPDAAETRAGLAGQPGSGVLPIPSEAAVGPPGAGEPRAEPASGPTTSDRAAPLKALQLHDSYLVAETSEGMVVIDQHALHERILYEELRRRVMQGGVESQRLLVPEPVHLSAADAAEVLERRDVLARLGLDVEPFGGDTVLVSSIPAMLQAVAPERLLRDLADHLRSTPLPPTADAVLEEILNMVACKAAIKAGQRLTPEEIEALLDRRHLVDNTHHCPHGRPTALVFTKTELEKQFGRI